MSEWRYLAERHTGNGLGELIATDLLLDNVQITEKLSGPPGLTCSVPIDVSQTRDATGEPLFKEWGTAIYAEDPNGKLYGGLLIKSDFEGPRWNMDCAGFSYYAQRQPYADSRYWVDVDPMLIHRHIWEHLQGLQNGNFGVEVDHVDSPVRIGEELENVEFVTKEGERVAFEAGPFKLNYFTNNNMGRIIDTLAKETPFDWLEHSYWDGEVIRHRIQVGYPRIGVRRHDMRFAIGENIRVIPNVTHEEDDYASDVLVLGSGEGRDKIAGSVHTLTDRPRRVVVIEDTSITSKRDAVARAQTELASRTGAPTITDVELVEHPNAPLANIQLGDEIYLEGWTGRVELRNWVRVTSITRSPMKSDSARVAVVSAETGGM